MKYFSKTALKELQIIDYNIIIIIKFNILKIDLIFYFNIFFDIYIFCNVIINYVYYIE